MKQVNASITRPWFGAGSQRRPCHVVLAVAIFLCLPNTSANADPYRLIRGDRIEILHAGAEEPQVLRVDVDGQVRLADLGGVAVAGLTLDEAEDMIETAVETAGLFVDLRVSMTVIDYAPIIVAGDVIQPGLFEYLPGMTVASALALSGGSQAAGITRYDIARASSETNGQLRTLNLEIAATVFRIARLQAALAELPDLTLPADLLATIPTPAAVEMALLQTNEASILRNDLARTGDLMAFWEQEIDTIETQAALFADRIAVQQEIVASAAEDLQTARDLQERGLQTTARTTAAEQRDADARSRVLELESARIAATRAIADARRERVQFLANSRSENLKNLQLEQVRFESLQLQYSKTLEQLALLKGGNMGALLASDALKVVFHLQSARAGRPGNQLISETTPILPGDTLIVQIAPANQDADG